jgi:cell wall-associated NlpC family hydrolase
MAVGTANANHFAVYLGENKIIHHRYLQLSNVETLRDFWRMSTLYVARHPDVPNLTPVLPQTSIKELVDARNRIQAAA